MFINVFLKKYEIYDFIINELTPFYPLLFYIIVLNGFSRTTFL